MGYSQGFWQGYKNSGMYILTKETEYYSRRTPLQLVDPTFLAYHTYLHPKPL